MTKEEREKELDDTVRSILKKCMAYEVDTRISTREILESYVQKRIEESKQNVTGPVIAETLTPPKHPLRGVPDTLKNLVKKDLLDGKAVITETCEWKVINNGRDYHTECGNGFPSEDMVISICPYCNRKIHFVESDRYSINEKVLVRRKEGNLRVFIGKVKSFDSEGTPLIEIAFCDSENNRRVTEIWDGKELEIKKYDSKKFHGNWNDL